MYLWKDGKHVESLKEKLIDLFNRLTASGVIFYYGDDEIEFGEITKIIQCNNEFITIEVDEEITKDITLEDFKTFHSKENINLYDWVEVREFDRVIEGIED